MAVARGRLAPFTIAHSCFRMSRGLSTNFSKGPGGRSSISGLVVAVFGATGFTGRYVVNRLARIGSSVICPFRGDEHDCRHMRLMGDLGQIHFPRFDLKDPESVYKCVQYANLAVNLVGLDYETHHYSFDDVHVTGARHIAEACRRAGVKKLIHFSALNADKDSSSDFLKSKALGEEAVRESYPDAIVMRPADVFGKEDRFLNYYASLRLLPFGALPILQRGVNTTKQPIYVVDVAKAVVSALTDPSVAGQTYELSGPTEYLLHDLVSYIYQVTYRPFKPYSPPGGLARFAARMLELSPFTPYMTRDIWKRLHLSDRHQEDLPRLEDLGVEPTRLEDTAISVLRRYRNFYSFNKSLDDLESVQRQ